MKAISLWQPWASAIALGHKRIETRDWPVRYRGPLLIHAARTKVARDTVLTGAELWERVLSPIAPQTLRTAFERLPFGAFVASCNLVDCVSTSDVESIRATCRRVGGKYSPLEPSLGNYDRGRWAWFLDAVQALAEPVPFAARQGLFDIDVKELPALRQQLGEVA